jgi:hypothetical protein
LPRPGINFTWVIENPVDNPDGKEPSLQITDFYSIHMQSQQCMKMPTNDDGSY